MRHQKSGRKFSRQSGPRHALFSNLVSALIQHERIKTTDAKAKELRRIAEKTISWATSVGQLVGDDKKADAADRARVIHAMRQAQRVVRHKPTLDKLFNELGPRLVGRPGGYTRIMKLGYRHGDAAPLSIIELVDREVAAPEPEEEKPGKKKGAKAEAAQAAAPAEKKAKKSKQADETAEEKPKKKAKKKSEE